MGVNVRGEAAEAEKVVFAHPWWAVTAAAAPHAALTQIILAGWWG